MSEKESTEEQKTTNEPQEETPAPEGQEADNEDNGSEATTAAPEEEGQVEITEEEIRKMSERVHTLQEESARMEQMVQEMQAQAPPGFSRCLAQSPAVRYRFLTSPK